MALLIGATLAVVSILILVYPFLKTRLRPPLEDPLGGASGDTAGLESVYQEISTLRLEYQLGKVPEDIYREQMRAYRLQAAVALREQARAGEAVLPGDPSEQDILAAQVALRNRESIPDRCPHCGAAVVREYGDCPACSASLVGPEGNAP